MILESIDFRITVSFYFYFFSPDFRHIRWALHTDKIILQEIQYSGERLLV